MATPVVVDFDFDNDPATLAPSIVFSSFPTAGAYQNPGVLRVIRGDDCTQQWSFSDPADATMSPASVATGDLDGDGHAEIVAARAGGGIIAFRYDPAAKTFTRYFRSGTCPGGLGPPATLDTTGGTDKWSGPSIHDLDDDGKPEIIYGATVYRADGCILSNTLGFPAYSKGVVPVIADVDEDGKMELVLGNAIHEWNAATNDWVAEPYFAPAGLTAGAGRRGRARQLPARRVRRPGPRRDRRRLGGQDPRPDARRHGRLRPRHHSRRRHGWAADGRRFRRRRAARVRERGRHALRGLRFRLPRGRRSREMRQSIPGHGHPLEPALAGRELERDGLERLRFRLRRQGRGRLRRRVLPPGLRRHDGHRASTAPRVRRGPRTRTRSSSTSTATTTPRSSRP